MAESCSVVLDHTCEAIPRLATTRAACFACGEPVCKACSRVMKWHWYGRKRVCANCDPQSFLNRAEPAYA